MKTSVIAMAASAAFFAPVFSYAGSFEDHFGGQEGVNRHLQGSIRDMQAFDRHLQGSINDDRKRIGAVEELAADTRAWTDRQEGVIRQNRGRLDENDARNQRQDASIDNAHARIGGVIEQADNDRALINGNTDRSIGNQQAIGFLQETDAQLSSAIQQGQQAHAVTDNRSINNAERLNGAEGAIRETNTQVTADRNASVQRDTRIESESIQRDTVIAQQVDYNESVNAAYRRQSAAQFEQHGAEIESNTQAIASERNERQQMGKDLNAGVAGALAAAAATFDPSYYGAQISVSGGSYRGESAVGLSVGARATESLFINGGVVHDSRGNQGLNAAVNWKL